MKRCSWVNLNNPLYVAYHDEEWGVPIYDDYKLFELLVLEMFQAGLSWECILNKRDNFSTCFDNFDYEKISKYDEDKVNELMQDKGIIRNRKKIEATINNAKIFIDIIKEYGSFSKYIWGYTKGSVLKGIYKTSNSLSDEISESLKKQGMKFVGTTIIYSYLQAIGIINDHEKSCNFSHS
jgi:DNA-3-methyladenine glycosylase I